MGKLWRIWKGATKLALSEDLAYRFDFILKTIGNIGFGCMGPIFVLLVYSTTSGIPGWSFEEFLLLTGTFILTTSIANTFFEGLVRTTMQRILLGQFDINLIRPIKPLTLISIITFNPDGLPNIFVGLTIVIFSLIKLGWIFNLVNLLSYVMLIGLALLFLYSLDVLIVSLAFLVTKAWVLMNMLDEILSIGKNPISIYGPTGVLLLTFFLPLGLAAFYPAQALLGKISLIMMGKLTLVAIAFFGFSLLAWNTAIKKYTSAGG